MNLRLYKPEVFQGNLTKKNYFEGWYFKHVTEDQSQAFSFIPGISLNENDPHVFIQVLNGLTGESDYISYELPQFSWERRKLYLKIGKSVFTDEYIDLNIEGEKQRISGHINYINTIRYPKKILSPGIMGWYSFVPFMECKHGIVSVNHDLKGSIVANGHLISFNDGKGYIEKDWGRSFPEVWLWIQANNFLDRNSSFCFSVAKIPWMGKFFIGFIAFLYYNRKFYLFATYNHSVIKEIKRFGKSVILVLENKQNTLRISCTVTTSGELKAPFIGRMSRRIKESIDSQVGLALYNSDKEIIYSDSSPRGGFEVIDEIFDYLDT